MRPRSDTLLIWTGASCSCGCAACPIDREAAPAGVDAAALQRALTGIEPQRLVVLAGGEPFLRDDLLRLLATIRAFGCVSGIVTTGRPLIYPQVRDKLRRSGVGYLRLQVFGIGEEHDRATAVPGSFRQVLAGLHDWLAESDGDCSVDVALHSRGRELTAVIDEIEPLRAAIGSPAVQLTIVVDAAARRRLERDPQLVSRLRQIAVNDRAGAPSIAFEGAGRDIGLSLPTPATFLAVDPTATCLGANGDTAPRDELHTVANSFNFLDTGLEVAAAGDAASCELSDRTDAPIRSLWLHRAERVRLYRSDTADFSESEIERIKNRVSHLFLDRAAPGVLDDFIDGMRRVRPDPICADCDRTERCGRRFQVVEAPPFATEEAWIAKYIAGLRGRVLDVGCGEQLYRDQLAPLLRAGMVEYIGLDPEARSLDRLCAALPEAQLLLGDIESFRARPASFRHILSLRSLNHVRDLDHSIGRMAELLAPGGELLLVETTAFAMLRRPEQVAAADRAADAGHQHFRDVTSEAILPYARRWGLTVKHHRPAGLATSNEWILLLERPRGIR
ncbi:MAG TPA: class I SAM-dependent methyltransferase [Terriglobales bacterium]|nr:class I SAM-dependent methyltransferase [Terriglobales bacterium]